MVRVRVGPEGHREAQVDKRPRPRRQDDPHVVFGVKCGGSLGMWESSGWIADSDPHGWFQWYCRFYSGRRCSDDARQIVGRWCESAGLKGRFRSQICNKIIAAGAAAGDAEISPAIGQTLLHWGLEITDDMLEKHRKRR